MVKRKGSEKEMEIAAALDFIKSMRKTAPTENGILREFLDEKEVDALLDAPDPITWIGRRDRTLLLVAVQTGLRVSELTALRRQDVSFGTGAHVRCNGKGRKLRCTPLRRDVSKVVDAWLSALPPEPDRPVFRGSPISWPSPLPASSASRRGHDER